MARYTIIGVLVLFSIGQSNADCMGPFMNCPPMPTIQPFNNVTSASANFNPSCPNITYVYNCYNAYQQNCTSSEQMFDSYQQVLGMIRGLQSLCNSLQTAYASNVPCISNWFMRMMAASPPPTPTTTGPCSGMTIPFMGPGAANMTSSTICASWNQFLQCSTMGVVSTCGASAGQLVADYYTQTYWYYTNKFGCSPFTVTSGTKTNAAQGLIADNFAVVAAIVFSTLIGWRNLLA